jgi:hypothetical protein
VQEATERQAVASQRHAHALTRLAHRPITAARAPKRPLATACRVICDQW